MPSSERLRAYLAQDPDNAELACDLADLLFAEGAYEEARATLHGLTAQVHQNPGVRFRVARLDLMSGDYAEAERCLSQLRDEGHGFSAIDHDIAFAQLCQRNTLAARHTLEEALKRYGESTELHVLQARVSLLERDYERAQQALDQALALDPGNATALGLSALAKLDGGDNPGAQEAADHCLALFPDQHEALLAAGALSLWQGDAASAHRHYQRALTRFPNSGRALSGIGQVLMLGAQLEEAQVQLQRAVIAMPDHIGTWHALAWTQLLQGDLAGAERSYRSAYDLDRNFAESHGGLAVIAMLTGRHEEGEASMKRSLKLDPHCINGRYAKTLWLEEQGEPAESTALFAELMNEGALPGVAGQDAGLLAKRLKARITSGHGGPSAED